MAEDDVDDMLEEAFKTVDEAERTNTKMDDVIMKKAKEAGIKPASDTTKRKRSRSRSGSRDRKRKRSRSRDKKKKDRDSDRRRRSPSADDSSRRATRKRSR